MNEEYNPLADVGNQYAIIGKCEEDITNAFITYLDCIYDILTEVLNCVKRIEQNNNNGR